MIDEVYKTIYKDIHSNSKLEVDTVAMDIINLYLGYQSLKCILLQLVNRNPFPRISGSELEVDTDAMDVIKVLLRISISELEVNTVAMDINKPLFRISNSELEVDTVAMDINKPLFRISNSELEVDTVAMDILNTNDLGANTMNPGLKVEKGFKSVYCIWCRI